MSPRDLPGHLKQYFVTTLKCPEMGAHRFAGSGGVALFESVQNFSMLLVRHMQIRGGMDKTRGTARVEHTAQRLAEALENAGSDPTVL